MIRNLIVFGTFTLASLAAADVATAQVQTNAALKALAAGSAPYIERAGYYAPGDGGRALYRWNATSTCTDDGGSCIMPNKAPARGRWLLGQDGAVSVKVFGAHCGGTFDDTAAFNAALAARSAVYIPANTDCFIGMTSPSSGIVLNEGNHLYGQNRFTSRMFVCGPGYVCAGASTFTGSYDFVAGGRFGPSASTPGTGIVVTSGVATVTTGWSNDLRFGNSVTISGSATAALNNSYTIPGKGRVTATQSGNTLTVTAVIDGALAVGQTLFAAPGTAYIIATPLNEVITAQIDSTHYTVSASQTISTPTNIWASGIPQPNQFNIVTPGVPNGTYTDPTHLTAQSGIGVSVLRSACQENPGCTVHVQLHDFEIFDNTTVNLTTIDMSQMNNATIHDMYIVTNGAESGKVAMNCSDQSPGNVQQSCYFNVVYAIHGPMDTILHASSLYGNVGVNSFHMIESFARVGIDSSGTAASAAGSQHSIFSDWYVGQPGDTLDWDLFTGGTYLPTNSTFMSVSFEAPTRPYGVNLTNFSYLPTNQEDIINLPAVLNVNGLVVSYRPSPGGGFVASSADYVVACPFGGTTVNLPPSPQAQYGGTGGQVLTLQARGNGDCAVSGNGNTINGFGSSMTVHSGQTVTLQWNTQYNDWEPITALTGQTYVTTVGALPSCGAALKGNAMYTVTDADATSQTTYNHVVTAGGTGAAANIPVFCNGTSWVSH